MKNLFKKSYLLTFYFIIQAPFQIYTAEKTPKNWEELESKISKDRNFVTYALDALVKTGINFSNVTDTQEIIDQLKDLSLTAKKQNDWQTTQQIEKLLQYAEHSLNEKKLNILATKNNLTYSETLEKWQLRFTLADTSTKILVVIAGADTVYGTYWLLCKLLKKSKQLNQNQNNKEETQDVDDDNYR